MVNQGTIVGRVGKIETKTTSNALKITNISMVTSKKFTKNGQKEEKITWHNVVLFSKLAEVAEKYVAVGDLLYIQGEMQTQKYTDGNGVERQKFLIIGDNLQMFPKSKEHKPEETTYDACHDEDIPW